MAFPKTLQKATRGYRIPDETFDNVPLAIGTRGYWPDQGMSAFVPSVRFAPDMGHTAESRFDASRNPFVVTVSLADLNFVGGSEGDLRFKSPTIFKLTIGGAVYEVPPEVWRRIRPGHRRRVFWESEPDRGVLVFLRTSPSVS
jgi:hypothetical protein